VAGGGAGGGGGGGGGGGLQLVQIHVDKVKSVTFITAGSTSMSEEVSTVSSN